VPEHQRRARKHPPKNHVLGNERIDVLPCRTRGSTGQRGQYHLRTFRRQMSPKRLPSPPTRSALRLHNQRRRLSFSFSIPAIASASSTAPARIIKLKLSLNPSRVLSVFRAHIRPVHLYLMRLEIELRIKYDKLLRLTHSIRTREMRLRKMQLLERARQANQTPRVTKPRTYKALVILKATANKTASIRAQPNDARQDILLIANLVAVAYKTLFVSFAHVYKQFIVAEKAIATECTQGVDSAFDGVLGGLFVRSMGYRGEMQREDVGRVECMFV
jgi:hypothetical protein